MFHKFTFFYNTKSPFSQWHKKDFHVNGIEFNCCEQYMMYCKAMLFEDFEIAKQILNESDPRKQKSLGREVSNFNQGVWDIMKQEIVYKGNYAKFSQNSDLKKQLMATSGTTLVEASSSDVIWGIGIGIEDPNRFDVREWRGENLLGYAITRVREDILKEEKTIQLINKMWKTIKTPVYLKYFDRSFSEDVDLFTLKDLELYHQQITIANRDSEYEGISVISFLSTWTDFLIDKKVIAIVDSSDPACIVGWDILRSYFTFPFEFEKYK